MKFRTEKMAQWVREHWMLLTIICLHFGLRFYRLQEFVPYDFDQEYVTQFVRDVVTVYPLRFIGQGISVQGLFLGPWYFYALVPFYLFTDLNPLGGFIGSVCLGSFITLGYYALGRFLFSKQVGLTAAFLRAVGFFAVSADWLMVPSHASDFLILLLWGLLYLIWKKRKVILSVQVNTWSFWLLPAVFSIFGLFTSIHPIQFHFGLVFLILLLLWKVRFQTINWIVALFAGLIPILPLLWFEYLRQWSMSKLIFGMLTGTASVSTSEEFSLQRVIYILQAANLQWQEVWNIPREEVLLGVIAGVVPLLIAVREIRKRYSTDLVFHVTAVITTTLVTLVYYSLFPTHVPEYYLRGLQVVYVLYLAVAFSSFRKNTRFGLLCFIGFFTAYVVSNGSKFWQTWSTSLTVKLAHKEAVVEYILRDVNSQPFQVSYVTLPGWQFGYASLFIVKNTPPASEGPVYTIVSPVDLVSAAELDFVAGNVGVRLPK